MNRATFTRLFATSGFALPAIRANAETVRGHMNRWPRDRYDGPGGGLYTGPGGGLYTGPDGGAYTGPDGGMYTGPDGGMYTGPDGGLYTGPGGGLYTGPGGGLYTGPGGGLYSGVGGFFYAGAGGGLYTGHCDEPFSWNWPPIHVLVKELRRRNLHAELRLFEKHDLA